LNTRFLKNNIIYAFLFWHLFYTDVLRKQKNNFCCILVLLNNVVYVFFLYHHA